jgi:ferredoxin
VRHLVWCLVTHRLRSEKSGASKLTEVTEELEVWIDQDLCTGDGLCVQYAPEVFEFDVDGLAYVKDAAGDLKSAPGVRVGVPSNLRLDVIDSAKECPGNCIHVTRTGDGREVAGPEA